MAKINLEKEWAFIIKETHKEKPVKENLMKRELLFALQILLSKRDFWVYSKTKYFYLKY